AGQAHAEIEAIDSARESVAGATLYCNLEPCSHDGPEKRTPPCVRRIIAEGISRVVVATLDPNPRVHGNGIRILREAGIRTELGLLGREAALLNDAYFKFIQTGRPLVHLKAALSLDGRIATANYDSKWITNLAARTFAHQLRKQCQAVMVGGNTAWQDDPQLTLRHVEGEQPWRVVMNSSLNLPLHLRLFTDGFRQKTLVICASGSDSQKKEALLEAGVDVEEVSRTPAGGLDLDATLQVLGKRGITRILVEGGGRLLTSFVREEKFDKLSFIYAPLLIGEGICAIGDLGAGTISGAIRLAAVQHQLIDDQVVVSGYHKPELTFGLLRDMVCSPELSKP
ncbi:MAG: bifunctional diaminohydroxyphosphoribosylaminopyrimidine deaminase/5-amino-6-(5-phosphoribosylamino)uracil reductase RibD, partial [Calditrichaeota bacterium]|nr:bifunctional diaminohydroxyphosphoribosylaminopyrimidine deaminase/5-amino-6-(5-phosphoribosylamino)uracil reductase RibD [Calditrichota bacterium]